MAYLIFPDPRFRTLISAISQLVIFHLSPKVDKFFFSSSFRSVINSYISSPRKINNQLLTKQLLTKQPTIKLPSMTASTKAKDLTHLLS
ncbi:MAG: hypothetical protein M5F18_09390, partial [Asgard group archaeon]|nr:hypothetical protein [Asgard group archaeon]